MCALIRNSSPATTQATTPKSGRARRLADRLIRWRTLFVALGTIVGLIGVVLGASFAYPHLHPIRFVNQGLALDRPLAIPPLLEPTVANGERVFSLTAHGGRTELVRGALADTAGFNGTYLGPTIRARTGERVRIEVRNGLDESTTVHWHGMNVPAVMDGGPHQPIPPGKTWSPYWIVTNPAATLWYHPHTLGKTAEQVYSGLAGLFLIDDENSDGLGLPKTYGVDDIPLIVQDRSFSNDGKLTYVRDRSQKNFGAMGDTILVNGTRGPYVEVPAQLIRLRILNASNARRYNFGLSDSRSFWQIATDGGLLKAPVERSRMLLGPGERAEIVVDLRSTNQPVTLMSYAFQGAAPMYHLMRTVTAGTNDEYQSFKILQLRPRGGSSPQAELPARLNASAPPRPQDAVRTRVFRMTDRMSINGKPMDHNRIDEVVKKGDLEIWEIDNREALFYHPFHIHTAQFQILDRNGKPPAGEEQGWKDTVLVNPLEKVRVIVRFADYADPHWPYMYHCHILDHEDMGMMGQFVVVENASEEVRVISPLTGADATGHDHDP
ncbi:multicopper oxidase domain-containing protein [Mycobacterium simiae]|uniref:Multicopper oxidase domain-containing protein n=1 Tax=Mycobacterium simiae TaxID=1784 RepID=A0A5B1BRB6_MYCSI|nr:multicopper oxidase domain-containing protein [Mycobacterium simiae]KAA1250936.1 multicopper oxidase domain-containing protein [Mycobacterium simiae]